MSKPLRELRCAPSQSSQGSTIVTVELALADIPRSFLIAVGFPKTHSCNIHQGRCAEIFQAHVSGEASEHVVRDQVTCVRRQSFDGRNSEYTGKIEWGY